MPPPAVPTEELLRHRAWVRSLARSLVADPSTVDDLEQEAWLAALERPPRHADAATTWLGRVVRSRATDLFRSRSRRGRREAAAARREATPSAAETVARAEAHRRVVEAVMSLDEPLRTAVLLRFFEDLPPREIARRTGVPVETARTRVRRGVERLRDRLAGPDEAPGRAALLLLAGTGELPAPGPANPRAGARARSTLLAGSGGGLLMTLGAKAAATAAVAAIAAVVWFARPTGDATPELAGAAGGEALDAAPPDAPSRRAARGEDAAGSAGIGATVAAPAASDPSPLRRVVVRREDGGPLDGAAVILHDGTRILRTVRLGADAALDVAADRPALTLVAVVPGRAPQSVPFPAAAGEVVLPTGVTVAGRVLLDGAAPGEEVRVLLSLAEPALPASLLPQHEEGNVADVPDVQRAEAMSGADGHFVFRGVEPGARGSIGLPWGWVVKDREDVAFRAPCTDLVLDCRRHPRLVGRVVRRGPGTPLAGGRVGAAGRSGAGGWSMSTTVERDGRFALYFAHVDPVPELDLEVVETDGTTSHRARIAGPFDRDRDLGTVEVEDPWAAAGRLRVTDAAGRPVAGAVAVAADEWLWRSRGSDADGIVSVPAGSAAAEYTVGALGHGTASVRASPGATTDVTLPPGAVLRVRIDGDGRTGAADAAPGALVLRVGAPRPVFDEPDAGTASVLREALGGASWDACVRNGDLGDFSWYRVAPGESVVVPWVRPGSVIRAEAYDPCGTPIDAREVEMRSGEAREVTLRVPPGRALRGRVVDARGRPVAGAFVDVRSPTASDETSWAGGWRAATETAADGTFALGGLRTPSVRVAISADGSVPWTLSEAVPGGDAIVARLDEGLRLAVRVLSASGAPAEADLVRAVPADLARFGGREPAFDVSEGADGVWTFSGLPPGPLDVLVERNGRTSRVRCDAGAGTVEATVPADGGEE